MSWIEWIRRSPAPAPQAPARDLSEPWKIRHEPVASAEDIFYCFRLILGRSPNPEEWSGHAGRAGSDLDSVLGSYVNSLEFSRRLERFLENKVDDRIVLRELNGFRLYVQASDLAVGVHINDAGEYEPQVTAVFRDRIKPGMKVLDIGANIGYFTMLAASLTGPGGHVMAIEPNAGNVKLLEASRRANAFEQVTVVQAAAGRELGLLVLNTSHSNGTTSPLSQDLRSLMDSTTVPSLKIDDLVPKDQRIDFIKIDVEGAEYNALAGASELIRRCRPTIASEFGPDMMPSISGVQGPVYLQFLIDCGYRISVLERDGEVTDCGQDPQRVMAAYLQSGIDHIDILMDPM